MRIHGPSSLRLKVGILVALSFILATGASAENTDLEEVGAALALPILTSVATDTWTLNVVSNVYPKPLTLHFNIIDGDDWSARNEDCFVTPSETVLFTFEPIVVDDEDSIRVSYECTSPETGLPDRIETDFAGIVEGIFFVTLEDPATGETLNVNAIFGDTAIIRYGEGMAWSAGAVSFQGIAPDVDGVDDTRYRFDGIEYSQFPGLLAANFVAPTGVVGTGVDAYLVLFTLDGTVFESPRMSLAVNVYNDDERVASASTEIIDCFAVIEISDISSEYTRASLGSVSGFITLVPNIVQQVDTSHDFLFDGGAPPTGGFDGQRRTPVHGWIFQVVWDGTVINPDLAGLVLNGNVAWGRTLYQGTDPLVPSTGDVPVFFGN